MGSDPNKSEKIDRRGFLNKTALTSGILGLTAIAGCQNESSDGSDGSSDGGSDGSSDGGSDGSSDGDSDGSSDGGSDGSSDGDSDDGTVEPGEPLPTYTLLNHPQGYNPTRYDTFNLVAEQMREVGFDVEVEVFEWGTMFSRIYSENNFDIGGWGRSLGVDPGERLPEMYHSDNTSPGDGNFAGYQNEDLDPKLTEQMQETDPDKRAEMIKEIQEVISRDAAYNPLVMFESSVLYDETQVSGWVDWLGGYNSTINMTSIEVDNSSNELVGYWPETINNLNVLNASTNKQVFTLNVMYDDLVAFDENLNYDPERSIATEINRPSFDTVEYTIREDHSWHDGEDLTVEDVVFTLEYIQETEAPSFSDAASRIDSVETFDGNKVRVTLSDPVGPLNNLFSSNITILPKHKWEGRSDPVNMNISEPVGSGPLQFEYWDTGQEIALQRFDDHFDPVSFDRRIWRIIPEQSTVWSLIANGDINYTPILNEGLELTQTLDENDNLAYQSSPGSFFWFESFNLRTEGLDERPVRQAAVQSMPKSIVVDQLLSGYGQARLTNNIVSDAFGKYHNDNLEKFEQGIVAARETLREGGFAFKDGKVHFPAE